MIFLWLLFMKSNQTWSFTGYWDCYFVGLMSFKLLKVNSNKINHTSQLYDQVSDVWHLLIDTEQLRGHRNDRFKQRLSDINHTHTRVFLYPGRPNRHYVGIPGVVGDTTGSSIILATNRLITATGECTMYARSWSQHIRYQQFSFVTFVASLVS